MPRLKLGEILIKQGLIAQEQLQKAIQAQSKGEGKRIGEILIRMGFITEEDMNIALGTQLGIPYYTSDNPEVLMPEAEQNLDKLLPADFAKKNNVLPLSRHMNSLTVAINDPLDLLVIDNLKHITHCEINLVIAPQAPLQKAINDFYFSQVKTGGQGSMLDKAVQRSYQQESGASLSVGPAESQFKSEKSELSLDKLIEKAGEAPVIKLVDLIIRQAIDERASDIHIEPFENKISLRYRIDGSLYNIPPPSPHLHLAIVSRIKILAKMDIAEKRLPQDGGISAKLENRNVDLRVSTIPTIWGEKVVLRILDKEAIPLELLQLGFDSKQVELFKTTLAKPYGLFFVTGPTGSGKSTTLYATIKQMVDPRHNILTIEDPVEYKLEGINQVAVKTEIGLTFASALRAFLRQDPNIIMVGEVRDLETATICVRAALTGHLVLSSLHTNDAASALTRLMDIGVPNYLLTPSLILIVAQRLARRLCVKCKEPYEPDPAQHGNIHFKSDLIYRAKGCDECNHMGYKGRVVVSEMLVIDDVIRSLISRNASYSEIKDTARKNGMDTIFECGIKFVEKGITSFDEICRVSMDVG